jgi:long-chain acyl-CoA synthetase
MHDLAGRVRGTLSSRPDSVLLEFGGQEWRRGDFARLAAKLEERLSALLPSRDIPVGLLIRNRPTHLGTLWALIAAGRPVAFMNPFQDPRQVAGEIAGSRLAVLIADRDDWASEAIREAARATATSCIQLGATVDESAEWVGSPDYAGEAAYRAPLPGVAVEMLSSGTSGSPKRIPLGYAMLGFSIHERQAVMCRYLGENPDCDSPAGTLIQYGPVVHLGGLFTALQAGMEGRRLALLEKFDVQRWREVVRRYRPSMLGLPPAQMRMVLDAEVPREDLAGALAARSGNALLDEETRQRFERRYGIPVLNIYGATEYCGPIASWTLEDHARFADAKKQSVGRLWSHVAEARILEAETGRELPSGEVGVLSVRIASVGPDWITTNDLAKLDADGFLYLTGRADDAINRGGFKIHPSQIEDVLRRHASVADAIVIGIPDARLGAVPVAAVEQRAGAEPTSEEQLRSYLRERLVAYQVPTRIRVLPALPRTPGLKVSRDGVRKLFAEDKP